MDITNIKGNEVSLQIVVNDAKDETKIHHYIYYIVDNKSGNRIGELMIYRSDNPEEFLCCGNVGIELYEEYRYKGYSGKAFELAKVVLKMLGIDKVILTCESTNVASFKSMEKVGAKYVDEKEVPKDNFSYKDGLRNVKVYEYYLDEEGKINNEKRN